MKQAASEGQQHVAVAAVDVLVCQSEDEVRESFRYWLAHVGASNLFPEKGLLEQVVHKVAAVPQRVVQSVQVAIARRKPLARWKVVTAEDSFSLDLLVFAFHALWLFERHGHRVTTVVPPCYNRDVTVLLYQEFLP